MSILRDILWATKQEVAARERRRPLSELRLMVADAPPVRSLRTALTSEPFSLIAEVKAKSPSGGDMERSNVDRACKVYENTPEVSAISVLTQEAYFGGLIKHLAEVRASVSKPVLRKDFIFSDYQIWEARAFGADAVLLMAALFADRSNGSEVLSRLLTLARSLGMDALVEIGMSNAPIRRLVATVPDEAEIVGINSRKFHGTPLQVRTRLSRVMRRDLTVSQSLHETLRKEIPRSKVAVAESGIHSPSQLRDLSMLSYQAALIGTAFLRKGVTIENAVGSFADEVSAISRSNPS